MSQWPVSNPVCHQFYSVDVITRPMKGCVRTNWRVWFRSSIFRGWRGDVRVEGLHVHLIMTGTCMSDMCLLFVYNPFSVTYSCPETRNGNMQEAKCGTKHLFSNVRTAVLWNTARFRYNFCGSSCDITDDCVAAGGWCTPITIALIHLPWSTMSGQQKKKYFMSIKSCISWALDFFLACPTSEADQVKLDYNPLDSTCNGSRPHCLRTTHFV